MWICEICALDSSRSLGMTVIKRLGKTGGKGPWDDTIRVWVGNANAHSILETLREPPATADLRQGEGNAPPQIPRGASE